jgi:RNA polymerase sigma-70 factor (ECF subfamily)
MAGIEPGQLGQWFDAYGDAMTLYARQWLDAGPAEDVVQEAFLKLMSQRRPPESPKAWLFRVVRNASLNRLRSRTRRQQHEQAHAAGQTDWFENAFDNLIDAKAAQAALEHLNDRQREIVILRIWAGLTLQEASETLNEPVSTLHSRYVAAIKALRERMGASCRNDRI